VLVIAWVRQVEQRIEQRVEQQEHEWEKLSQWYPVTEEREKPPRWYAVTKERQQTFSLNECTALYMSSRSLSSQVEQCISASISPLFHTPRG
jgi:hypothetical protein